jgi:magnesium-transporting ATPase (P-type)
VGIPIGAILLFAFAVQAYLSLFYKERNSDEYHVKKNEYEYRFEKVIAAVSRFNIFTIGFLVLLGVLSYWVVPNLIVHMGRLGVETLARYKWIFLSFGMIFLGLIIWIIYLKYLLAKKAIASQTEIDKYRLQLEFDHGNKYPLQLVHDQKETTDGSL